MHVHNRNDELDLNPGRGFVPAPKHAVGTFRPNSGYEFLCIPIQGSVSRPLPGGVEGPKEQAMDCENIK